MRVFHYITIILFALSMAGCTNIELAATAIKKLNKASDGTTADQQAPAPHYKIGNPYEIFGQRGHQCLILLVRLQVYILDIPIDVVLRLRVQHQHRLNLDIHCNNRALQFHFHV